MKVTKEQREAWLGNTAASPFNLWLEPQIRNADGMLDLGLLHAVARRYGVDCEARYAHLNPGQQRMNIGNLLRTRVPVEEYGGEAPAPRAPRPTVSRRKPVVAEAGEPRPEFIRSARVLELMEMHSQIIDELRAREVVRTGNAPLGDYVEHLFSKAFGWDLLNNSAAGHDAEDAEGVRYQIKGRRLESPKASRQLSVIRRLPENRFDFLAAALFDRRCRLIRGTLIPHSVVLSTATFIAYTNSWRFNLDDRVWDLPGVRDVSEDLRAAEAI